MASPDDRRSSTEVLERRCRRLLVAYPRDYRAHRGEEIVATMVEVAGPGRRTPSLPDAVDLVASGLWRRIGTVTPSGLAGGLAVAAPVAVAIAAGISLFAWWRVEPMGVQTVGPVGYGAWLLAAIGWLSPRPAPRRALVALAISITVLLPVLASALRLQRPPLWVLMALSGFGVLALAGTAPAIGRQVRAMDERLAVPAGAIAVAFSGFAVTTIWPASGGVGYYYQPTIARVGVVIALAMAVLAIIAVVRLARGGNAQPWLWATALLGLPAGWFGPFDSIALRSAADQQVPHFGRLAQVLLASSVAMIAMAWLARRPAGARVMMPAGTPEVLVHSFSGPCAPAAAGDGRGDTGVRSPRAGQVGSSDGRYPLAAAGWGTLGCAVGLAGFTLAAAAGRWGFTDEPGLTQVPRHVLITVAGLTLAGLCGIAAGPRRPTWPVRMGALLAGFSSALGAAWLVASYDNDWTAGGWTDFAHTTGLVMTLAFVPFTYSVIAAAQALSARSLPGGALAGRTKRPRPAGRTPAAGVVAVSLGWIGYVAVPYLLLWGPVLVIVLAGGAVFALSGRRGASSAVLPR